MHNIPIEFFEKNKDEMYFIFERARGLKRYNDPNWTLVERLTGNGSGYSIEICKILGVDPHKRRAKWSR